MYFEGSAKIEKTDKTFLNPEMKTCRDISVAVLKEWPNNEKILDAMCATGIRGIRYILEDGAKDVTFLDASDDAISMAKKNLEINNVHGEFVLKDANEFLFSTWEKFDVIELDPFGTPSPYLLGAARAAKRSSLLSVTATDTAVLCGAHTGCEKIYGAKPGHNECCKEVGLRILLGKIARDAGQWNFGIIPWLSLSSKHFMKVFVELKWGAEYSDASAKLALGNYSYCQKCMQRSFKWNEKCDCGEKMRHAGPLWVGDLFTKIPNSEEKPAEKLLGLMRGETKLQKYPYYDLHKLCELLSINVPSFDEIADKINSSGFGFARTHIDEVGFRTDMPLNELKKALVV